MRDSVKPETAYQSRSCGKVSTYFFQSSNSTYGSKDFALSVVCLYEEQIKKNKTMKARLLLPVLLVALSLTPAIGQPQPGQTGTGGGRGFGGFGRGVQSPPETSKLTAFSLDFPGGTPQQLVTAIEKAITKPLNVIIPAEHTDFKLPPLKMNKVNMYQLFEALELTSQKTEKYVTGTYYGGVGGPSESYQQIRTSYGFRSPDAQSGALSDDSIWYFYVERPTAPPQVTPVVPKVCRFYALASYLERGLTVDDITTAIQTGWKMLGDKETPTINFHKETKLLIAVGEQSKLVTIDAVLEALGRTSGEVAGATFSERVRAIQKSAAGGSSPPPAKPPEKPKTEN